MVLARQAGFKRIALQTHDLRAPGRHPGAELGYVPEGQLELRIVGQPPRIVKAGETFFVSATLVHDGVNTGSSKTKGCSA
jgi:quercetin dioxygenase-like cupin family protein